MKMYKRAGYASVVGVACVGDVGGGGGRWVTPSSSSVGEYDAGWLLCPVSVCAVAWSCEFGMSGAG